MSQVRVQWVLQPVTSRQRPIRGTRIDVRVDPSLPWTAQDEVAPDVPQELVFVDVAPGTHYYRAVVIDIDGVESKNPKQTSVDVPFDPPNDVAELTAVVE